MKHNPDQRKSIRVFCFIHAVGRPTGLGHFPVKEKMWVRSPSYRQKVKVAQVVEWREKRPVRQWFDSIPLHNMVLVAQSGERWFVEPKVAGS